MAPSGPKCRLLSYSKIASNCSPVPWPNQRTVGLRTAEQTLRGAAGEPYKGFLVQFSSPVGLKYCFWDQPWSPLLPCVLQWETSVYICVHVCVCVCVCVVLFTRQEYLSQDLKHNQQSDTEQKVSFLLYSRREWET
jgi:hypothetical protein